MVEGFEGRSNYRRNVRWSLLLTCGMHFAIDGVGELKNNRMMRKKTRMQRVTRMRDTKWMEENRDHSTVKNVKST